MSFSDEFMPDDDSNSFDALLGLLTPPVSPEKVSKVQGQDRVEVDESFVQQLFGAVQIAQVQALDSSRAPAPAADTAATVDEGSESDAEGEDDPDLLFPDFLGDDQPQEIQPIMLTVDLPVFSLPPVVQSQRQAPESRESYRRCIFHTGQTGIDKVVLKCHACEMMKCVNIIINEERRLADAILKQIKDDEKRKAGIPVPKTREPSKTTIERDGARKKKIKELVLLGAAGLTQIENLVPAEQFVKLVVDLKRRETANMFPFDGVSLI